MSAIERITGFTCEVDEEQWRELVDVATCLGVKHSCPHHSDCKIAQIEQDGELVCLTNNYGEKLIPYPDFLAKLKGVEKWEPKNGERVEVSGNNQNWHERIFIVTHANMYYCVDANDQTSLFPWKHIRPLRPTITRKEAEEKLNARIID